MRNQTLNLGLNWKRITAPFVKHKVPGRHHGGNGDKFQCGDEFQVIYQKYNSQRKKLKAELD